MYDMKVLSERKVKSHEALNYFLRVICDTKDSEKNGLVNERALNKVQALYNGAGMGSMLESANGTAWGLVNAVTEYVDHHRRARNTDNRMDSAWFGQGASIKQRALDHALLLAA
jgi:phage/plasmid-like protein (TIGR03299 family)